MTDWTDEQIASMAACLCAEAEGTSFRRAKALMEYDPPTASLMRRLAHAALEHLHYLPGEIKYLIDPIRQRPTAPFHWLGGEADHR